MWNENNDGTGEPSQIGGTGLISSKWIAYLIQLKFLLLNNKKGLALMLIILILLAVTIIVISHILSKWLETENYNNPRKNPKPILAICTGNDLNLINPDVTQVLRVEKPILEISPPDFNDKNKNDTFQSNSVRELVISNQISEIWLYYFISKFPALEIATLDVYQLCLGSNEVSPDAKLLWKPLTAQNLKTLILTNFNHCDSIPIWIFRWEFPRLVNLTIRHGTLSRLSFTALTKMAQAQPQKILKVECHDCKFCSSCNATNFITAN